MLSTRALIGLRYVGADSIAGYRDWAPLSERDFRVGVEVEFSPELTAVLLAYRPIAAVENIAAKCYCMEKDLGMFFLGNSLQTDKPVLESVGLRGSP